MDHLLTIPEAFALIIAGITALYFIASVKSQDSADNVVEVSEGNYTTPAYIERYGAVIQAQQYN